MKSARAIWIISCLGLFVAACEGLFCPTGPRTISEPRALSAADTIVHKAADMQIILEAADAQEIVMEGTPNAVMAVETRVKDGRLMITDEGCYNPSKNATLRVATPAITAISVTNNGGVVAEHNVFGDKAVLNMAGSGTILLKEVGASTVASRVTGDGEIFLGGGQKLTKHRIQISGTGNVNAYNLPFQAVVVSITGEGTARVWAETQLDVTIEGSGNVYYQGNPTVRSRITGTGELIKLD